LIPCVDSHCHLQSSPLGDDVRGAVLEARAAGVRELLSVGITPSDAQDHVAMADEHGIWTSIGCHPCHADEWDPEPIERWATHPRVVAIGECGLDYYHKPYDKALQEDVFRRQIRVAKAAGLPLILHNRESDADLCAILRDEGASNGVFHCFGADRATLETALELGFHISFAGNVTYPKAVFRALVPDVPLDRLLVETDAPYLAPTPHRGKPNRPAWVLDVLAEVAKLRQMDVAALGEKIVENFGVCFPRTRSAA
jgi:TatD DNase family protein